jgi:hypothetical protein
MARQVRRRPKNSKMAHDKDHAASNGSGKFASIEDLSDEELQELHDDCRARVDMTLSHIDRRRNPARQKPRAAAQHAKSHRRTKAAACKS